MGIITDDFKLRKSRKKQFPENLQQGASGGNQPQVCISLPEMVRRWVDTDTLVGLQYRSSNEPNTSFVSNSVRLLVVTLVRVSSVWNLRWSGSVSSVWNLRWSGSVSRVWNLRWSGSVSRVWNLRCSAVNDAEKGVWESGLCERTVRKPNSF